MDDRWSRFFMPQAAGSLESIVCDLAAWCREAGREHKDRATAVNESLRVRPWAVGLVCATAGALAVLSHAAASPFSSALTTVACNDPAGDRTERSPNERPVRCGLCDPTDRPARWSRPAHAALHHNTGAANSRQVRIR